MATSEIEIFIGISIFLRSKRSLTLDWPASHLSHLRNQFLSSGVELFFVTSLARKLLWFRMNLGEYFPVSSLILGSGVFDLIIHQALGILALWLVPY